MPWSFDTIIVGAGFAGLVLAERLTTQQGKRVLIVEKRDHIGGNSQDYYDEAGVLVHKYGPHYFRTNSDRIKDYLSQFTEWNQVTYRISSFAQGRYWSFPINLATFEQLIGRPADEAEFVQWLEQQRIPCADPKNSEEVVLDKAGKQLYELFFRGYTLKQWRRDPRELDASVCARVPIRTNRDDSYLREAFQALPKHGYHKLFERMLAAMGSRVRVLLNTDYREVLPSVDYDHMIYTGPIDAYFDNCYGRLPYRSLRFEHEHYAPEDLEARRSISGQKGFWQPTMQVNYPDAEVPYTRTVEIKHATGQQCANTTVVREFPMDIGLAGEPYYPVPNPESARLYQQYRLRAAAEQHVSFVGRLATYRYYNMDQVVGMALTTFAKLCEQDAQRSA